MLYLSAQTVQLVQFTTSDSVMRTSSLMKDMLQNEYVGTFSAAAHTD